MAAKLTTWRLTTTSLVSKSTLSTMAAFTTLGAVISSRESSKTLASGSIWRLLWTHAAPTVTMARLFLASSLVFTKKHLSRLSRLTVMRKNLISTMDHLSVRASSLSLQLQCTTQEGFIRMRWRFWTLFAARSLIDRSRHKTCTANLIKRFVKSSARRWSLVRLQSYSYPCRKKGMWQKTMLSTFQNWWACTIKITCITRNSPVTWWDYHSHRLTWKQTKDSPIWANICKCSHSCNV